MGQSVGSTKGGRGQIAFEFLIVYSFVLIVFVTIFLLIASQRAATVNAQQYSTLQLIAQTVAGYIDEAVYEGNGYNATLPLPGSIGVNPYNITVSTTGVVIASVKVGSQVTTAYAFSSARNLVLNGTLTPQSNNAINLYVIPTKNGYLKIGNLNGVVFVGKTPLGTGGLLSHLSLSVVAKERAATFNGGNGWILLPNNVIGKGSVCSATIMAWSQDANMPGTGKLGGAVQLNPLSGTNTLGIEYADNVVRWTGKLSPSTTASVTAAPSNTFKGQWILTTLTLSGGTITGYINNVSQTSASGLGCMTLGNGQIGNWDRFFNGTIADVRIYNLSLSSSEIQNTFYSGMDGPPVESANLVAWYKLNGDTNDYSGNNRHAYPPNGITYQTFAQVRATSLASNGLAPASFIGPGQNPSTATLTGFLTSANVILSNWGAYNSTELACNGTATVAFSSNNIGGQILVRAVGFNANTTYLTSCGSDYIPSKLVAWYPLTETGGGTAYDMAGNYYSLTVSGYLGGYPALGVAANQTFVGFQAANFPGNTRGTSGAAQNAWINMTRFSAYNAMIVPNKSFTAVAWINMRGITKNHPQGIFGNFNTGTGGGRQGFQIYANSSSTVGCVMVVNGISVNWPTGNPGNFPINGWVMITGEYSNLTGQAQVWMNNTLFASNNLGAGLGIAQTSNLVIGADAAGAGAYDTFNGYISNAQLYSSYLNQSQVNYLYRQGATGAPLTTAGVVGWWPLDGDYKDYSTNSDNGIAYNVVMTSAIFSNYTAGQKYPAAAFSPVSGGNALMLTGAYSLMGGNTISMIAWFNPTQWQGASQRNGIFTYGPASGTGARFSAGISSSGVPEFTSGSDDFTPSFGPHANPGTWNFGAWVLSGNAIRMFLNGQWVNGTLGTVPNVNPGNIIIGSSDPNSPTSKVFNGLISDVQVYNTVLPGTQIWQLYEQGLPPIVSVNVSS